MSVIPVVCPFASDIGVIVILVLIIVGVRIINTVIFYLAIISSVMAKGCALGYGVFWSSSLDGAIVCVSISALKFAGSCFMRIA